MSNLHDWSTVPEQMCMLLASIATEEKTDGVQKVDVYASSWPVSPSVLGPTVPETQMQNQHQKQLLHGKDRNRTLNLLFVLGMMLIFPLLTIGYVTMMYDVDSTYLTQLVSCPVQHKF